MKAVPRRLLILGGGPVGVEMAQAVTGSAARRWSSTWASTCSRASRRRWARRSARLSAARGSSWSCQRTRSPRAARARTTCSRSTTGASCAGRSCSSPPVGAHGLTGIGLETIGVEPDAHGVPVDAHLRAAESSGRSATSTACGRSPTSASTRARWSPRTSSASRGRPTTRPFRASSTPTRRPRRWALRQGASAPRSPLSELPKTATYTRAYAEQNGFLTLLSDGERLTGAYALGPEAGEWLQQATLAIRAHVPLEVLADTIQPFPTFSEIYVAGLKALRGAIAGASTGRRRGTADGS